GRAAAQVAAPKPRGGERVPDTLFKSPRARNCLRRAVRVGLKRIVPPLRGPEPRLRPDSLNLSPPLQKVLDFCPLSTYIMPMKSTIPPTFESALDTLGPVLLIIRRALEKGTAHVQSYSEWQDEPIDRSLA